MTPTARLNKLEMLAKPANPKDWQVPFIEAVSGQEQTPDHIKLLTDLKEQAKATGWNENSGIYAVEVIKHE